MAKKIHFPKGEGIKIIRQASEAKEKDSIYILAVDDTYAEMIVVSVSGAKRKIGFRLPENVGLTDIINDDGDVTTEGSVYLKEQVDKFLSDLEEGKTTIANTLETLKGNLESHINDANNPHGVTASQIGLENVNNTSDADKPISNAQKTINDELLESITEVEDLANNKLSKTTTAIATPTSEFKYIYLTNEANETRRMLAGDLGKNIANSTLVSIAGAGFTQGANWTHNTAGFYYYVKGLPDKSNDATFDKVMMRDSNGQVATSSNAQLLVNGMKKMTDGQKDQYRSAYLKTNEQYSTGQPIVSGVFPKIISRATSGTVSMMLYGRNLFINNVDRVSKVDIINIETQEVVETISNIEVHQTMPSNLSFELDKSKYTKNKKYTIQVTHNGLKSIIDSTVWFQIIEEMPQTNDVELNWTLLNNSGRTEGTREKNGTFNFVNKPNDRFEFNLHTREDNVVEDGILNVYTGFEFEQNKSYYLSLDFYIKDPDTGDYSVNAETLSLNFLPKEEFVTDNNVYYTKGKLLKSGSQGSGTGNSWHACAGVASETYGGNVYTHTGGYFTAKILIQKGRAFISINEKFYDAGYIPSIDGSYVLGFSFRNANAIKNNNEKQVNLRNVSILEIL